MVMDNNTFIKCSGFSEKKEEEISSSFDWRVILSGSEYFVKETEEVYSLRLENQFGNVSAHGKFLSYHTDKQDFRVLAKVLSEELERHYSCKASVCKGRDRSGPERFDVSLTAKEDELSGPAAPEERRTYYSIPDGDYYLYVQNSPRVGVYVYTDGKWRYDSSHTVTFQWDRPSGKLCGILPEKLSTAVRLDAFLAYSEVLLYDMNADYYAVFDEKGVICENKSPAHIPAYLPQSWPELREEYIGPSYSMLFDCLDESGREEYLRYPDFDRMNNRIGSLNLYECIQYLGFAFRAALKYGQKYFFSCWQSGKFRRILVRIRELQDLESLRFSRPDAEEFYAAAYRKCSSYFSIDKGKEIKGSFPVQLLDSLKMSDRIEIEKKIISACQKGESQFFGALNGILLFNLNNVFTGESVREIESVYDRTMLFKYLYKITQNPVYLNNMLRLAAGDQNAYEQINKLIIEDHQNKFAHWQADSCQLALHTMKTINTIRAAAGKETDKTLFNAFTRDYEAIELMSRDEVTGMLSPGSWDFEGSGEIMKFYTALDLRYSYLDTRKSMYLKKMIIDALDYPEVYDVLKYMVSRGEIKRNLSSVLDDDQKISPSGKKSYPMIKASDFFRSIKIVLGNLCETEADVIVNTTDSSYSGSGGIDRAVHKAAGEELGFYLKKILKEKGPAEVGKPVISPAFSMEKAGKIIHLRGPVWENGFKGEEAALARCYRKSLYLVQEEKLGSVAFPCISTGANRFPERRAAEIALHTVYNRICRKSQQEEPDTVIFVCSSEKSFSLYRRVLKRMILDQAVRTYSPESEPSDYDYNLILLLTELEWGGPGDYGKYTKNFKNDQEHGDPKVEGIYACSRNLDRWDYNTCLAYIIYLQRQGYWSGGEWLPLYEQVSNGVVREVLLRMKRLTV